MKLKAPTARLALALVAGAAALLWSGYLAQGHLDGRRSALDRVEAPLLDMRFALAGARPAPRDVLIVAIDDETVRGAGTFPLPRGRVAELVRTIARAGPSALGLDILFLDPSSPAGDRALEEALREAGAIIAAAGLLRRGTPSGGAGGTPLADAPEAQDVLWPLDPFRRAASVGLVNIAPDDGGTPRHIPLLSVGAEGPIQSFVLRLASMGAQADPVAEGDSLRIGPVSVRTDLAFYLPLRFNGPRGTVETVSAASILRGAVAPERLRGRIVVVGATAIGTGDTFPTPYDPILPGVEVLATAIGHLTAGDGLVRDRAVRRADAIAAVALSVGTVLLLSLLPLSLGVWAAGLAAAAWLAVVFAAFAQGWWLSATIPFAAMALPFVLCVALRLILDRRGTLRLAVAERALRRLQAPAIGERIARDPGFLAEPRAQRAAVLFVDLSRFTRLSERLGPAATRDLLRAFHGLVEAGTTRHGGIVLSFMGDGAMIVFGLPEERPDDAARALRAARDLILDIRAWIGRVGADHAADIDVRVGAHCGPVVVSRLGADDHEHITATGDTVNTASRLLEVAAQNGAALAASADLIDAARGGQGAVAGLRDMQRLRIRGRREPLTIAFWSGDLDAEEATASSSFRDVDHGSRRQ